MLQPNAFESIHCCYIIVDKEVYHSTSCTVKYNNLFIYNNVNHDVLWYTSLFALSCLYDCMRSLTFNFLYRCLLLFHSCTCACAHTIPCSKSECWCFTHWHPDRPAQLTYLWYARECYIYVLLLLLQLLLLVFVYLLACAVKWISFYFYLICSQDGCPICPPCIIQLSQSHSPRSS